MRKVVNLFVMMTLVAVGALVIISPALADVGTSSVSAVTPGTVNEGATLNVTFTVSWTPADAEYLSRLTVTLPAQWTINSVGSVPAPDTFCGGTPTSGNAGQDVWFGEAPDGCGPWDQASYNFTVNVTVTGCTGAPWDLPWLIEGDGFGVIPHSINGAWSSIACTPAGPPPELPPALVVPNLGLVQINGWQATHAYGMPGMDQLFVLPADADGNGFDTYVVADVALYEGEYWLGLFIGSQDWVWVRYDAVQPLTEIAGID